MTIEEIKDLRLDNATPDQITDAHQLMNNLSNDDKLEVVTHVIDIAQQRYPDGVATLEVHQFLLIYRNELNRIKTNSLAFQREQEEKEERKKQLEERERGFALLRDPFTKREIITMDLSKLISSDTNKIILLQSMENLDMEDRVDIIEQIVYKYENTNPYGLATTLRNLAGVFNMLTNKNIVDTDEVVTNLYNEDFDRFRIFYNLLGINERHHFQRQMTKKYNDLETKEEKEIFEKHFKDAGFKLP